MEHTGFEGWKVRQSVLNSSSPSCATNSDGEARGRLNLGVHREGAPDEEPNSFLLWGVAVPSAHQSEARLARAVANVNLVEDVVDSLAVWPPDTNVDEAGSQ